MVGRDIRSDVLRTLATFLVLALLTSASVHASTWTVNDTGDPASPSASHCPGTCALRDAIVAAGNGDTIVFAVGASQTITLTSNVSLALTHSVTVDGSGSPGLIVDGYDSVTVFVVPVGVTAAIANLQITHGVANQMLAGCASACGGGIAVAGSLTITNVVVAQNHADGSVGAIPNEGGGIFVGSGAAVSVLSSSISNNSAANGGGISVLSNLNLDIVNSTISANSAGAGSGGGVFCNGTGVAHLWNSTVSGNTASIRGSGLYIPCLGGSFAFTNSTIADTIYDIDTAKPTAQNSILASCAAASKMGDGAVLIDAGGNIDADGKCLGATPNATSKALATFHLGPLQNNGGSTLTMLPAPGSDAIGRGIGSVCAAAQVSGVDQRGFPRPPDTHCDAGAVQIQPCYVKGDATGANDGSSWADAYTDLQSALAPGGCSDHFVHVARGKYTPTTTTDSTISFNVPPGLGIYGGFAGIGTERDPMVFPTMLSGDLGGKTPVHSYHVVTMDGTTAAGPITASTVLDGLTIAAGNAIGSNNDADGGGLFCNGSNTGVCSPALNNLYFFSNAAAQQGGAIFNYGLGGTASPTITNSTFNVNNAADGGAIANMGDGGNSSPILGNVTFRANGASDCGGAIFNFGEFGIASPLITNATFAGNTSSTTPGAVCDIIAPLPGPGGGQANPVLTNVIFEGGGTSIYNTPTSDTTFGSTLNYFVTDDPVPCPPGSLSCTNQVVGNPHLFGFSDFGGATPTEPLGTGSVAIGTGLNSACSAAPVNGVDQRGVPRPEGTVCDIGAVESTNVQLTVSNADPSQCAGVPCPFGFYGQTTQYIVELHNLSLAEKDNGVQLAAFGSAALNDGGSSWRCLGGTGGTCTTATQSGALADTAAINQNGVLTWLVNVPIVENPPGETATLTVHSNVAAATQVTIKLAIFRGTFEAQ